MYHDIDHKIIYLYWMLVASWCYSFVSLPYIPAIIYVYYVHKDLRILINYID